MSEPTQSETESTPRQIAPEASADGKPAESSTETPAFNSVVELTFSLEIASVELTQAFAISCLQLKPISNVVSMCLEPSRNSEPGMNLQINFEVADVRLADGVISTIRLRRSSQQGSAASSSQALGVSRLEFVTAAGNSPFQLTPSHQVQMPIRLTTQFQIAAVEFSTTFEVEAIVLKSTSRKASIQLSGSAPSTTDNQLVFQIETVELGEDNKLKVIKANPRSQCG